LYRDPRDRVERTERPEKQDSSEEKNENELVEKPQKEKVLKPVTEPKLALKEPLKPIQKAVTKPEPEKPAAVIKSKEIVIPKSLQPKVLGEKDANLKQIGYDAGVKFEKKAGKNGSLVVTIIGEDEQLNAAFLMIKQLSDE